MAETATAKKKAPAKKAAAKKTSTSSKSTNNQNDPTTPPATTAGVNATKEVQDLPVASNTDYISEAQRRAQEQLASAEAIDKVNSDFNATPDKVQQMIEENDKKGVDKDGNLEDPGLTDRLMREKLASITPAALARENVAYVTDQENIFNVTGLSAPAVPVVGKDSGK